MNKTPIPRLRLIAVTASCSADEHVVDIARQSADRQALQNQKVSRLNREVALVAKQLVEVEAQTRDKIAQPRGELPLSHIVTINTQLKDPTAIYAACQRLNLPPPTEGTTQLFSSQASGIAVQLPDWRYPVRLMYPG